MRLTQLILAAVLTTWVTSPARAADASGTISVIGAGLKSCGWWTQMRREQVDGPAGQWVFGYLTAIADWVPAANPLSGLDADAVDAWMDNYCRSNPLNQLIDAGRTFYGEHPK